MLGISTLVAPALAWKYPPPPPPPEKKAKCNAGNGNGSDPITFVVGEHCYGGDPATGSAPATGAATRFRSPSPKEAFRTRAATTCRGAMPGARPNSGSRTAPGGYGAVWLASWTESTPLDGGLSTSGVRVDV